MSVLFSEIVITGDFEFKELGRKTEYRYSYRKLKLFMVVKYDF